MANLCMCVHLLWMYSLHVCVCVWIYNFYKGSMSTSLSLTFTFYLYYLFVSIRVPLYTNTLHYPMPLCTSSYIILYFYMMKIDEKKNKILTHFNATTRKLLYHTNTFTNTWNPKYSIEVRVTKGGVMLLACAWFLDTLGRWPAKQFQIIRIVNHYFCILYNTNTWTVS